MEAIICLSHWSKGVWAEGVALSTSLLFYCCFWCITCSPGRAKSPLSHAYILTCIPFCCFEMKKFALSLRRDFTMYREVDEPIFLVSLIKLGDASIKSSELGARCRNLFLPVPPATDRKGCLMKSFVNGIPEFSFRRSVIFCCASYMFAASITVQSKHTYNL